MKKWLLAFLIAVPGIVGFSQQTPDSLLTVFKKQKDSDAKCETLIGLSDFYYHRDPKLGIDYSNQALSLSKKLRYETGIAKSWLALGKHRMVLGDNDQAKIALDNSISLFKKQGDHCNLGIVYMHRGSLFGNLSKFPDALDALFEALRHLEKCDDAETNKTFSANCYQNIANIYNATENFDKALINYDKAIKMWDALPNNKVASAMNLASKGIVYEKQKKYDAAIDVYTRALSELKKLLPRSEVPMAFVDSWLAKAYFDKEMYDQSLERSNRALGVISKIGDQDLLASALQTIAGAMVYKGIKTKDANLANEGFGKLEQAIEIHKQIGNHEGLIFDFAIMTNYYKFISKFDKALKASQLSNIYKDSVFNFKNKQSLQNLEDERTIELRNKELQISKLTIDNKEKQKWYLIAAISLLAVIGILLYYQSHNRRRINRKLQNLNAELDKANQTKTKLFSIIGHDLRGPVSHIYQFLELQKTDPDIFSEQDKVRHNDRITAAAGTLLETMEDLLIWSKSQMQQFSLNPQKFDLAEAVSGIAALMQSQFERKNVSCENHVHDFLVVSDRNIVTIIVRNILQNALNASDEGSKVTIDATSSGKETRISISDNGNGMPQNSRDILTGKASEIDSAKSGLGLSLVYELGTLINARFEIVDNNPTGTSVTILLPAM